MKKQVLIMGLAAILVLTAVIGGTIAAPTISANKTGDTTINIEDMEVALAAFEGSSVTEFNVDNAAPGFTAECPDYVVKNAIANGYDLYARVTIDKQWKNGEGLIETDLDADVISLYFGEGKEIAEASIPEGWLVGNLTSEQVVLYYTKPLKSGEATSAFLSSVVFDTSMNNKYTNKTATIDITVDAVQASIAEKAMLSEWGVVPTLDENGAILAITE